MERIPILKIGHNLLVSIQVDMHDQLALNLQDDLANAIARHHARGVIIDITALDIVDSFIGRTLAAIAKVARIMDCRTVIVGMRPAVAITLVELGMTLPGIQTALDLEKGMQLLAAPAERHRAPRPAADERLHRR
ncbi:MAG: STAS domain-containing protein [Verrucomicrobia bacterium]|nr:MAG: STAS domain-containing protein [Verrucomicrobiota bacterium]